MLSGPPNVGTRWEQEKQDDGFESPSEKCHGCFAGQCVARVGVGDVHDLGLVLDLADHGRARRRVQGHRDQGQGGGPRGGVRRHSR